MSLRRSLPASLPTPTSPTTSSSTGRTERGGGSVPSLRVAVVAPALALAVLFAVSGCGSAQPEEEASAPKTVTVTETATATATPEPTPEQEEAPAEDAQDTEDSQVGGKASSGGSFAMPNEVGKALQAAQDDLQALSGNPFFYSDSEDATGQGRFQVLDSGWKVCKQNKRPGTRISEDDQSIVFGVVRVSESCP